MEILLAIIVISAIGFYILYAGIIRKRNTALEAFSGIDVQLKKRHDLIPNILTLAKKFMTHEKELLTEITKLRTDVQKDIDPKNADALKEKFASENALNSKMGSLFVAVENYPDLKSNQNVLQAQQTYNEVEEHIAASRRFFNSAVTDLNNSVQIFPGSLVAGMIGVKEMTFFEASGEEKKAVNAGDFL